MNKCFLNNKFIITILILAGVSLFLISFAQNFLGPNCAAGQCQGKIGVNSSGNISIGTSTPQSDTRTYIVGATSDSSAYGLKIISSNSSPVLWVRNDGKVSIATTSFNYVLNVGGDIYASGNLTIAGNFSAPISAGNITPGVFNSLQGGGTGAYAFLGSLGVATTSQVGLPQALSVYGGGYFLGTVGIGTTTPSFLLHLVSDANAIIGLQKTGTNSNVSAIYNDGDLRISSGRNLNLSTGGSFAMSFRRGTTEVMRIPYNKNFLGIGDIDPDAILEISAKGSTTTPLFMLSSNNDTDGDLFIVNGLGNVGIGTTTPSYKLDVQGGQINASGGLCIAGDCKTSWSQVGGGGFWTQGSGGIYYTGNVLIGTTTLAISYPLLVSSSTDNLFVIRRIDAPYPTIFKQGTDGALVINNNNSDILTIKSGNVGIGTTNPSSLLHIYGTGSINATIEANNSTNDNLTSLTIKSSGSGLNRSALVLDGSHTSGRQVSMIQFNLAGSNKWIQSYNVVEGGLVLYKPGDVITTPTHIFKDTGIIGFGTTTPAVNLHLAGSGDTRMRISGTGTDPNTWVGVEFHTQSEGIFRNLNDARLVLWNSGERLTVTAGGNVGIGTSTPTRLLQLVSNNAPSIEILSKGTYAGGNAILFLTPGDNNSAGIIKIGRSGNSLFFKNSADTTNMTLTHSGNLGIGTTSPAYKLDVASGGSVTARLGTTSTDTVIIGGGAGKITVGTVDPVYNIRGEKYATYLPGMTGQKEETTGVITNLICVDSQCKYEINFNNLEKESDLWLFYQITDFGPNWENLVIILTPNFDGRVWYKKDFINNRLIIYSNKNGEISYRLTAPRFDWKEWNNKINDNTTEGLFVPIK